ncbi:TetR/AcrR family transcriptional regulator [Microtetraspora sp. AC03309]|uniref:TetR/AcrR family transcriptional regulator n=1 Tax=Microtetraspora sp. AC03309 TaxID=2779376 RepID=UPI001E3C99FB|nr:TetR/AcrR family transcriptional regulator [Microtetraspora sp. AC03309]MCC5579553.1 TetR/AcrR family transcriptional regulator [Microtetraspora sp. AC03309]
MPSPNRRSAEGRTDEPATEHDSAGRRRDPGRSRQAILDAAERIFAREGYDGASLVAIGKAAGVSGTLPAYFFKDKATLYAAVVERLFDHRDHTLERLVEAAIAALDEGEDGLRRGLDILVGGYLRFLLDRPAFVRLMSRDALEMGRAGRATTPRHSAAYERGLRRFIAALPSRPGPGVDPDQLLISVVALCFFPMEHDATMLAGMGYRAWSTGFVEKRADHVVDVLLRVLAGPGGTG